MESNSIAETRGRAVPFVIYQNKKFVVTDEAKEVLCSKEYKNIGIISLVGKYRTGKSFLLNRVLLNQKKENGFDVGPTIRPCTKGIWMWSEPLMIENNHCKEKFPVFMIDTEGLGAYDEEINHDSKIFLIAVLISSLFIFNSFGNIDENSINSLSFILNLSKTIKLKENSENSLGDTSELAKYFPSFLWLLRDFSLKLEDSEGNTITAKQYLENALTLLKGSSESVEEKNKVRKMIQTYFTERDCFSMVRPVEDEKDLQNLQTIEDSKIRIEFLDQAETLRNKVSKKVKPKLFNNKFLNGSMLCELLKSIIDSINLGAIPVIESSWKYVMHNESIKNMNEVVKKFISAINTYKEENKENPSFFSDLTIFFRNTEKNLTEEFNKMTVMDETTSTEYLTKIKSRIAEEYKKFNEENAKFFENRMTENLEKNTKKIIDTFDSDKYVKNYYQFFQDLENLREISEASTPDFPMKKEIIFEKMIHIVKKFIEMTFLKNKITNEKEIVTLRNELHSVTNKLNFKSEDYESLKSESKENIDKLNDQVLNFKMNEKAHEEKIKNLENDKKNLISGNDKKIFDLKREMEDNLDKIKKEKSRIEAELKSRDDQILTMKFTEEKTQSLNSMKSEFYEKEIAGHKERHDMLKKDISEYRKTIDELNLKIDELKNENNNKKSLEYELEKLKMTINNMNNMNNLSIASYSVVGVAPCEPNIAPSSSNPINMPQSNAGDPMSGINSYPVNVPTPKNRKSGQMFYMSPSSPPVKPNAQNQYGSNSNQSNELVNLVKSHLESSKLQVEENKKIYDELVGLIKSSEEIKSRENEEFKLEFREILESNKILSISLSNYEKRCIKLEEKIIKLKSIKELLKSATALQCKICAKFFTYDIFTSHSPTCKIDISKFSLVENTQKQPDKLTIKILKGILNNDELGKPYIEYIIEIYFKSQSWRVNKKFNHFANLHKTLKALFADVKFPDSGHIFSKLNMNGKDSNNYHENKKICLEKYLKDIAEIGAINKSRPFRKFMNFDENIDNEDYNPMRTSMMGVSQSMNFNMPYDDKMRSPNLLATSENESENEQQFDNNDGKESLTNIEEDKHDEKDPQRTEESGERKSTLENENIIYKKKKNLSLEKRKKIVTMNVSLNNSNTNNTPSAKEIPAQSEISKDTREFVSKDPIKVKRNTNTTNSQPVNNIFAKVNIKTKQNLNSSVILKPNKEQKDPSSSNKLNSSFNDTIRMRSSMEFKKKSG